MAVPKNKEELLSEIEIHYSKLKKDLVLIPHVMARDLEIEGNVKGTLVSAADVVAYLVGWSKLVRKWEDQSSQQVTIIFPEKGFKWTELGLLAQHFHKTYKNIGFASLLEQLDEEVELMKNIIHSYDNETLYHVPFYKTYPLGRMIQLNTSSPYKSNRSKLRKWMRGRAVL